MVSDTEKRFPVAPAASERRSTGPGDGRPRAGTDHVLVVDDDPRNAQLFVRVLAIHGYAGEVVAAYDGAQALGHLSDARTLPRLVLLDLNMPGMDGLETLRRIRANARTALVPVVVWSCSEDLRDVSEAYRAGANAYVPKASDLPFPEIVRLVAGFWLKLNEQPPS